MPPVKKKPVVMKPQENVQLSVDPKEKTGELTLKLTEEQLNSAVEGLKLKKLTPMQVVYAVSKDRQNTFNASELNKALRKDRSHLVDKLSDLKKLQVRIRDEKGRTYTLKDLERIVRERGIRPEDMEDRPIILEDEGYKLAVDEAGKAEMEVRLSKQQFSQALDAAAEPGDINNLEFLRKLSKRKDNPFSLPEVNKRLKQDKTHQINNLEDTRELNVKVLSPQTRELLLGKEKQKESSEPLVTRLMYLPFTVPLLQSMNRWEKKGRKLSSEHCKEMIYLINSFPPLRHVRVGREATQKIGETIEKELETESEDVGKTIGEYAREYPRFFDELIRHKAGEDATKKLKEQYNIDYTARYPTNILEHMIKDKKRVKGEDGKPKPLCVAAFAKHDWNGAFNNGWPALHELSKQLDVRIVEAGHEEELMEKLRDMEQRFGKAKVLILGAHGSPEEMRLGVKPYNLEDLGKIAHPAGLIKDLLGRGEKGYFDITDRDNMAEIKGFLDKDPYVILDSCSTGKAEVDSNLAKTLSKELGDVVFAATHPTTGVQLETREDGEITDMSFPGGRSIIEMFLWGRKKPDELLIIYKDGKQVSLMPLEKSQPPAVGVSIRERIQQAEEKQKESSAMKPGERLP